MKEEALDRIEYKLDTMITLLGSSFIQYPDFVNKNQKGKILLLSSIGLDKYQIAKILCMTPENVRVAIAKSKIKSSANKQFKNATVEEEK